MLRYSHWPLFDILKIRWLSPWVVKPSNSEPISPLLLKGEILNFRFDLIANFSPQSPGGQGASILHWNWLAAGVSAQIPPSAGATPWGGQRGRRVWHRIFWWGRHQRHQGYCDFFRWFWVLFAYATYKIRKHAFSIAGPRLWNTLTALVYPARSLALKHVDLFSNECTP